MNEWIFGMANIFCNSYAQYNIIEFTIDWLHVYVCRNTIIKF